MIVCFVFLYIKYESYKPSVNFPWDVTDKESI